MISEDGNSSNAIQSDHVSDVSSDHSDTLGNRLKNFSVKDAMSLFAVVAMAFSAGVAWKPFSRWIDIRLNEPMVQRANEVTEKNHLLENKISVLSNELQRIKVNESKLQREVSDLEIKLVEALSLSEKNKTVAVNDIDKTKLKLPKSVTSLLNGEPLIRHDSSISSVALSEQSNRVAVSDNDWNIHIYSLETGEKLREIKGHQEKVTSLDFSENGERLLSSSDDGTTRIWNVENGIQLKRLNNIVNDRNAPSGSWQRTEVPRSKFIQPEERILLYGTSFQFSIFDADAIKEIDSVDLYPNAYLAEEIDTTREGSLLSVSPSDAKLARQKQELRLQALAASKGGNKWVEDIAVSANGRYVGAIVYGHDRDVVVYDTAEREFVFKNLYRKLLTEKGEATGFFPKTIEFYGDAGEFFVGGSIRKGSRRSKMFLEIYKNEVGRNGVGLIVANEEIKNSYRTEIPSRIATSYSRGLVAFAALEGVVMLDVSSFPTKKRGIIEERCPGGYLEFINSGENQLAFESCAYTIVKSDEF